MWCSFWRGLSVYDHNSFIKQQQQQQQQSEEQQTTTNNQQATIMSSLFSFGFGKKKKDLVLSEEEEIYERKTRPDTWQRGRFKWPTGLNEYSTVQHNQVSKISMTRTPEPENPTRDVNSFRELVEKDVPLPKRKNSMEHGESAAWSFYISECIDRIVVQDITMCTQTGNNSQYNQYNHK